MRYRFDLDARVLRPSSAHRPGLVLLGGTPRRLIRLSEAGRLALAGILDGQPAGARAGEAVGRLGEHLADLGLLHPCPDPADAPFGPADVTVVIPAHNRHALVGALVSDLSDHPGPVIVVDDGSVPPITRRDLPDRRGGPVELCRREVAGGPGVAREAGLERVATPLVAFIDSDVQLIDGWLAPVLGHFVDRRVGVVGPRIVSGDRSHAHRPTTTDSGAQEPKRWGGVTLARYERMASPLDLGSRPGWVRPRGRVAYLPAAVLVARVDALAEVGGFDPEFMVGEDVDLLWRLDGAGWRVRYEPTSEALHPPRPNPRDWLAQRFGYGTSAAPLALRHRGQVPPTVQSGWSLLVWGMVLAGHPWVGGLVALGSAFRLSRRCTMVEHPLRTGMVMGLLGQVEAGRGLARAAAREWWPFTLAACVHPRLRRRLTAAVIAGAVADWADSAHGYIPDTEDAVVPARPRRTLDPVRYTLVRVADHLAYGAGVWAGMWRHRTIEPIRPQVQIRSSRPVDRSWLLRTLRARGVDTGSSRPAVERPGRRRSSGSGAVPGGVQPSGSPGGLAG